MLISAHFPLNNLARGLQYIDFPFILSQYWHRKEYRDTLLRFQNTFAIVDNGVHERGEPLAPAHVAAVLSDGGAWIGFLPDYIHKPIKTWRETVHCARVLGLDFRHWGLVLHGDNPEHIRFQHDLAVSLNFGLIAFPYKAPRHTYLKTSVIKFEYAQRYHLMGLSEKDDLTAYAALPGKWSIDSMKIWKIDLSQPNWHGHTVNFEKTTIDFGLVKSNIQYLKDRFNARTS
jgi:hypothetical protein